MVLAALWSSLRPRVGEAKAWLLLSPPDSLVGVEEEEEEEEEEDGFFLLMAPAAAAAVLPLSMATGFLPSELRAVYGEEEESANSVL